jgi:iron complex transport system ATP-binding protein
MSAAGTALVEVRGAVAGYGATTVLHGVDLRLERGEVVGLIGPNGSGKSTLVGVLSRVVPLRGGEALVDGTPIARLARRALAARLAVVPQGAHLPEGFTAADVVRMGRTPHAGLFGALGPDDDAAVEAAMRATDTRRFAHRAVEALSGGERQRVVLARALAQRPSVLLLDEPTSHLDLRYQVEALALARAQARSGLAVLAVLHDLNAAARACDRLVLLDRGRVVAAGPPSTVRRAEVLAGAYGVEVEVRSLAEGPLVLPRI